MDGDPDTPIRLFDITDRNEDGVISQEEMKAALYQVRRRSKAHKLLRSIQILTTILSLSAHGS
jgi:hypothetical protein